MPVTTETIQIETRAQGEMIDLTDQAQAAISGSNCTSGIVTLFVAHTTAAIVISEFEPGLVKDLPESLEALVPRAADYVHNRINHDDNAHSHILGSLLEPSITVPFAKSQLLLGTWQRIVLIDLDTHPRTRSVVIQVMGE